MRKNIRFSLGFKFSVVIMLMSLLIGALIVLVSNQLYNQHILDRYARQGEALVNATAKVVDWDKIDYYYDTLEEDDAYGNTLKQMRLCADSGDAEYLFVLKPLENGCVYIYDTDESDERCELGYYMDWYEAFGEQAEALMAGQKIDPVVTNEEYGWLLSIYVPFTDSNGSFVAYLGVDYSVQHLVDEQWSYMGKLIMATLLVSVAMTALFLVILRSLVLKPINAIASAANSYLVNQGEALREKSSITSLDITTRDELQSLSESLKTMEYKIQEYIAHLEDATYRAETDSMTTLLNREAFEKRVNEILDAGGLEGYYVFMMIDLDNFKTINDTFGHVIGDEVISETARSIRSHFRSVDLIARMGGDEFAVFYRSPADLAEVEARAGQICESIRALCVRDAVRVTVSVGVAVFDGTGRDDDYQKLYMEADDALYEVKMEGRDGFSVKAGHDA